MFRDYSVYYHAEVGFTTDLIRRKSTTEINFTANGYMSPYVVISLDPAFPKEYSVKPCLDKFNAEVACINHSRGGRKVMVLNLEHLEG